MLCRLVGRAGCPKKARYYAIADSQVNLYTCLAMTPPPHVVEQGDQSDQSATTQSTGPEITDETAGRALNRAQTLSHARFNNELQPGDS